MGIPHPRWLYPKGGDVGLMLFSDLNLSVDALCITKGGGIMVWGPPLDHMEPVV